MTRVSRTTALLVMLLTAALALSACGGSDDPNGGDPTTAARSSTADPSDGAAARPRVSQGQGKDQPSKKAAGREAEETAEAPAKSSPGPSIPKAEQSGGDTPDPQGATRSGGCPAQFSSHQCDQLAEAVKKGEVTSPPERQPTCPAGLSQKECAALAEAGNDNSGESPSSQAQAPTECPAQLSQDQCRELEAALGR
jgi:hypothetical protein